MLSPTIKERLEEAVRRDGRSMRSISQSAGLNQHFVSQLISTGREPGIGQFMALCDELKVSVGSILYGHNVTHEEQELARMLVQLPENQRRLLLELARTMLPASANQ